MTHKYLLILLAFFAFTMSVTAQEGKDLGFYPNPVNSGKIYITSKSGMEKEVTIYNVLGKLVLQQRANKEVNISALIPGVYIVKIKEGDSMVTRKLVIK